MNDHGSEFSYDDFKEHPSRVMPVLASLGGGGFIVVGLVIFFSCILPCDPIWKDFYFRFGLLLAVPVVSYGLLFFVTRIYALLTTRYTEPFGTNAFDRAWRANFFPAVKNGLAAIALIFWLFLCIGCLAFL